MGVCVASIVGAVERSNESSGYTKDVHWNTNVVTTRYNLCV
jgi:hypothetical protein